MMAWHAPRMWEAYHSWRGPGWREVELPLGGAARAAHAWRDDITSSAGAGGSRTLEHWQEGGGRC